MIVDTRKIRTLLTDADALLSYLDGLSNSQFRAAGQLLGDSLLVEAEQDVFWPLFRSMFLSDRKAYLGTLLKALAARLSHNGLSVPAGTVAGGGVWDDMFVSVCDAMTDTDRRKALLALLPLFESPADVERLLVQCGLREFSCWIPYLLQVQSRPCAFVLLKALRYVEHDRALLVRTCHLLMKRGDEQSFAVAALMRLSFGLDEVRGTFSLTLKPYQLARVEQNYDAFLAALKC